VTDILAGAGSDVIAGATSIGVAWGIAVVVDVVGISYTCVSSVLNNKSTNFFVSGGGRVKFKP